MANPKNKWSRPAAPPAPMFFGEKERDLVKQINDELAERVIGQSIAYYPISVQESTFNTYGEAVDKVSLPPIRVFAFVEVENEQSNEVYGYEYQSKLTVNFNRRRLVEDQDLFVRVGDFVQYGDEFYEIVRTYNDTRYYFGQVDHKFQISAECVRARKGVFRIEEALTRPTTTTPQGEVGPGPDPRDAPYPPLAASYLTVDPESKLPNERVLAAGVGISLTDTGPGGTLTIASTGGGAGGGIFTQADASNAYTTSSILVGNAAAPSDTLTVVGSMSGSGILQTVGAATFGSTLNVSGALSGSSTLAGLGITATSLDLQSGGITNAGVIAGATDITASNNIVANGGFFGDGSGITGISADAIDITSSSDTVSYNLVFTEGFQTDGSRGLAGNTGLLYNPGAAQLSTSAGIQVLGNSVFEGTLGVSGTATFGTDSVVIDGAAGTLSASAGMQVVGATILGSTLSVTGAVSGAVGFTGASWASDGRVSSSAGLYGTDLYLRTNAESSIATIYIEGTAGTEIIGLAGGNMNIRADGGDLALLGGTGNELHFGTDNTNSRMVMDTDGNVGIGTTNPSDRLTVVGGISGSTTLQTVGATVLGSTLTVSGAISGAVGVSGSDARFEGAVSAGSFYGDGSGITNISADGVDVTSSAGDFNYPLVFTQAFQTDGGIGLGGNTDLTFNASDVTLRVTGSLAVSGNTWNGTDGGTIFACHGDFAGNPNPFFVHENTSAQVKVGVGSTTLDNITGTLHVTTALDDSAVMFESTDNLVGFRLKDPQAEWSQATSTSDTGPSGGFSWVQKRRWNGTSYDRLGSWPRMCINTYGEVSIGTKEGGVDDMADGFNAQALLHLSASLSSSGDYMSGDGKMFRIDSYDNLSTAPVMFVTASGRVGIGTETPSAYLHVSGPSANPGVLIEAEGTTSNPSMRIKGRVVNLELEATDTTAGDIQNYISFVSPSATWHLGFDDLPNTMETGFSIKQSNNLGPEFYIHSDGNVLIGRDAASSSPKVPQALLHLTSSTAALLQVDHNDNSNILFVTGSGRVGIGTNAPSDALHISATDAALRIQKSDSTNTHGDIVMGGNGLYLYSRADSADGIFSFNGFGGGSATEFMRIDGIGNVGIGTDAPSDTLTVVGTLSGSSTLQTVGATILGNTLTVSGAISGAVGVSGSDARFEGAVSAGYLYGDGTGITNISADGIDVSSSADNADFNLVFTQGFQADGSRGLAGNTGLIYNPSTAQLSSSAALQLVGATSLGSTLGVTGSALFGGGITHNRTAITAATYTILVTDYYLGVDSTSNQVALTLPAAATAGAGKTYIMKDETGAASSNDITITGDGSETIDGAGTLTLNQPYVSIGLYTDGSNWFVY